MKIFPKGIQLYAKQSEDAVELPTLTYWSPANDYVSIYVITALYAIFATNLNEFK